MSDEHFQARRRMVSAQLRARGIADARVLEAMERVPRHRFVPAGVAHLAYDDRALTIGSGQTISQPYMVALMTELLELSGTEHVLEVGTGSGYQAAVLAELARSVVTIERHEALSRAAAQRLAELGYTNVTCVIGDGTQGEPRYAPYDRILVAAASSQVPAALVAQLAAGGILVIPRGEERGQVLEVYQRHGDRLLRQESVECRFVPLLPGLPAGNQTDADNP